MPRTHNIRAILEKFEPELPETVKEEYRDLFENLTVHYLNDRYTDYKQKLSDHMHKQTARDLLTLTKEAFAWLLTLRR